MELSTLYRECTLNQVSENDIGKERRVAGWVENIRDHGGVSFIDLRDMYGVLQIVMRDTSLLKGINKEDCISVLGEIEKSEEILSTQYSSFQAARDAVLEIDVEKGNYLALLG